MQHIQVVQGKVYDVKLYYDAEIDATIVELVHYFPGEIQREAFYQQTNTKTITEEFTMDWKYNAG